MSFRRVLRYRFDNLMSRGVLAQILLLAIVTTFLVMIGTFAIVVLDLTPAPEAGKEADTFGLTTWKSLMRAMDPGTLAGDNGSWSYLFVLLGLTVGGIFVLSALIGVL